MIVDNMNKLDMFIFDRLNFALIEFSVLLVNILRYSSSYQKQIVQPIDPCLFRTRHFSTHKKSSLELHVSVLLSNKKSIYF